MITGLKKLLYKSGIYSIINIENNKQYIGSSINIGKRIKEHIRRLNKNIHHSIKLQRSWNKYEEKSFKIKVLEFCSKDNLIKNENYYLNKLSPFFNISKDAKSPMLNRKHKAETIEKFKLRKTINGKDHYLYGTKWSEAFRKKVLESRKDYKHSEETKLKMSKTSLKLNRYKDLLESIENRKKKVIDSNYNKFNSMTEAAKFWEISRQTVCDILKGRHSKTRKGISFKYV